MGWIHSHFIIFILKKGQDGLPQASACPDWENAVYYLVSPVHTPKQSVLPDCDGVSFSTDCAGLSVLPDCDGVSFSTDCASLSVLPD
jgi:hypothetical protein